MGLTFSISKILAEKLATIPHDSCLHQTFAVIINSTTCFFKCHVIVDHDGESSCISIFVLV